MKIPSWAYIAVVLVVSVGFIAVLAFLKGDTYLGAEEDMISFAEDLGMDVDKFKKDLKDEELEEIVMDQKEEGEARGVTGTPTVFINNVQYSDDRSYNALSEYLNELIEENSEEKPLFEVFSDFHCGNCAQFDVITTQLKSDFGDQVIFKDLAYPFLQESSYDYAIGHEAAKLQGFGDEMAREIYKKEHGVSYDSVSFEEEIGITEDTEEIDSL